MGIKEAVRVEPDGDPIVTARRRNSDGTIEPVIDLFPARKSEEIEPGAEVFVAQEADPFYSHHRLGVISIHRNTKGQPATMELLDTGNLGSDPHSLHEAMAGLLEVAHIPEAVVTNTNLPPTVLRQAGAVALGEALEFKVAA